MRQTDDQLREILERSEKLKRKASRRIAAAQALSAAACFVLLLALSLTIPTVSGAAGGPEPGSYGSLILSSPQLGYMVIAVVAFLLGVCVTLLCVHLRKQNRKDGKNR